MEKAQLCRGSVDWPETACLNSVLDRGGSDRHRVSSAHLTAARRLPVCAAGDDPASDPIIIASLPEAARHLALPSENSKRTRSVISTSTSPICAQQRARSTCPPAD